MYHSISEDPELGVSPYYKVCTSPRRFGEHMQWLAEAGYRGVSVSEGLAWLNAKAAPHVSEKLVAITFDDGFRDFHNAAFPALRRHGFTATMYLPTAFIGDERKSFKFRECLTWAEVNELKKAGMEFGSHTVNHPTLVKLSWPEIELELDASKKVIQNILGLPTQSFAYPYAFPQEKKAFASTFRQLIRDQGYNSCCTTVIGRMHPSDDPANAKRLPINDCDDQVLLRAKLRGAYDWVGFIQRLTRSAKTCFNKNC